MIQSDCSKNIISLYTQSDIANEVITITILNSKPIIKNIKNTGKLIITQLSDNKYYILSNFKNKIYMYQITDE